MSTSAGQEPIRKSSLDQEGRAKLERRISNRPDPADLIDRNILKSKSVAPALVAAKEKLQRSQLEDKLDHELKQRPKPEELIEKGILREDEVPSSA